MRREQNTATRRDDGLDGVTTATDLPAMSAMSHLVIDAPVVEALRESLPDVATETVGAITVEVPSYTGALSGSMGTNINAAVQMALAGFLKLTVRSRDSDPSTPLGPTLEGAYALGRGEARSGRSMDALLAAYRVGARVAWREMAHTAADAGLPVETMAEFAELVFAYIDQLSAASVAGHSDELSTSGRVRERYLELLARRLLAGANDDVLEAAVERADWTVPRTLTAVLLPAAQARGALAALSPGVLHVAEDLPGLTEAAGVTEHALLFVPDMGGSRERRHLLRVLRGRGAVVGPSRPWTQARASYERAMRVLDHAPRLPDAAEVVDTETHLADLVLRADPDALRDLRARVLAPLQAEKPASAERLADTLLSWLLHQGRRDAVAADLHVHPQTVRYRMGRLRELYGERLDDPHVVLELLIALGSAREAGATGSVESTREARRPT